MRRAVPGPAARVSNVPPASTRGRRSDLPVSGSDRRERSSRRMGARGPRRLVRSRCCARGRGSGQHGSCQHRRRKYPSGARCYQRPRCRRCAGSQRLPHTILILIPVHDLPPSPQHAVTPHLPLPCANAGRQDKQPDAHADCSFVDFPARKQPTCPRGRRAAWTPL